MSDYKDLENQKVNYSVKDKLDRCRGEITHKETEPSGIPAKTPGAKLDKDKLRAGQVLPYFPHAIEALATVGDYGLDKYSEAGFLEVSEGVTRYYNAFYRHLLSYQKGNVIDEDSGLPTIWQVLWNIAAMIELMERGK